MFAETNPLDTPIDADFSSSSGAENARPSAAIEPINVEETGALIFDWERLRTAFADKDFPVKTYIKYAILLTYGASASFVPFDAVDFAEQLSGECKNSWGDIKLIQIHESEVLKALADLARSKQLELTTNIQLTLHF